MWACRNLRSYQRREGEGRGVCSVRSVGKNEDGAGCCALVGVVELGQLVVCGVGYFFVIVCPSF